jgi:ribonuclease J
MMMNRGRNYLLDPYLKYEISKEEIDEKYKDIVMIVRPTMFDDLAELKNIETGNSIYSIWDGYRSNPDTKVLMDFFAYKGLKEKVVHTSGHADINGLQRMIEAVKPKHIVPIHTFNSKDYADLFYNWKVLNVKDGQQIEINN